LAFAKTVKKVSNYPLYQTTMRSTNIMKLRTFFNLHPITYLLLAAAIIVVIALLAAPASSASANQCSACHGTK
jgi:hypothetical protein